MTASVQDMEGNADGWERKMWADMALLILANESDIPVFPMSSNSLN